MNSPEDKVFEDYQRGDSDISKRYRELRADEVPAALDELILAQARDELEPIKRTRRWRTWVPPFALAASALLAVSILFRAGSEREALITQMPTASAPSIQPNEGAATDELKKEDLKKTEPQRDQAPGEKESLSIQPELAAVSPPPSASQPAALAKPIREKLQESPPPISARSASQFAMTEAQQGVPSTELDTQNEVMADTVAQSALPSAAPPASEFRKAAGKIDAPNAARDWLTQIRKLRADGRNKEADRQWREFRKTFPDYSVAVDDSARPKP